jgi:hypothetical protein
MSRTAHQSLSSRSYSHDPIADYMLGLPKSRSLVGNWLVIAVAAGIVLAFVVLAIGNLIF